MRAGMSLEERNAQRETYRQNAIQQASLMGMSERCKLATQGFTEPSAHQVCRGEDRGNGGCLCLCHDNPGAVVLSRHDEPPQRP